MRLILAYLVACFSLLPCVAQTAGKVTRVIPQASVIRASQSTTAATDQEVKWGDTIKTDAAGRARVVLTDGSILMITSNSTMLVVSHDEKTGKTQLELKYGYVRASVVGAIVGAAPAQFEIRTNTAVCGVLGTQFEVETDDTATQTHVYEGKVDFTNSKSGEKMSVIPGQTIHLLHRSGRMQQGLAPRFAARTRQRWQNDRAEIMQERVQRNQARQQRAVQARQAGGRAGGRAGAAANRAANVDAKAARADARASRAGRAGDVRGAAGDAKSADAKSGDAKTTDAKSAAPTRAPDAKSAAAKRAADAKSAADKRAADAKAAADKRAADAKAAADKRAADAKAARQAAKKRP